LTTRSYTACGVAGLQKQALNVMKNNRQKVRMTDVGVTDGRDDASGAK